MELETLTQPVIRSLQSAAQLVDRTSIRRFYGRTHEKAFAVGAARAGLTQQRTTARLKAHCANLERAMHVVQGELRGRIISHALLNIILALLQRFDG